MFFWFKPRRRILHALCANQGLVDTFPIAPAQLPRWWRELPGTALVQGVHGQPEATEILTARSCPGIREFYQGAFGMPLWADYEIAVDHRGEVSAHSTCKISQHAEAQWGSWAQGWTNFKLESPWTLVEDRALMWTMEDDVYARDSLADYRILPGRVEYRYQHTSSILVMTPRARIPGSYLRFDLSAGSSMVLLRPCSGEHVEVRSEAVTPAELARYTKWKFARTGDYLKAAKIRQRACPFGSV